MYQLFLKRFLDVIMSILVLLLFSPIIIILIIVLALRFNGTPFFVQSRPGQSEKIFNLIKFKSMTDKKGEDGELLPFHDRLTTIGIFIRKFSLDELPQLINVLKGDMSIIGPRPLLVEYLEHYNDIQKKRHNVKPGISGWAQVNGRNSISWDKKFELDIWYVKNISFKTDLKIMLLTVKKVILKDNVNKSNTVNMPTFKGSN